MRSCRGQNELKNIHYIELTPHVLSNCLAYI